MVGLLTLLLIVAAVPLTLYLGQQQQDVRQRAAEQVCTADQATDAMIILDESGSMNNPPDEPNPNPNKVARVEGAKTAAKDFLSILSERTQTPLHQVSLTFFSDVDKSRVVQPLTTNLNSVRTAVDTIKPKGETCIECGIKKAVEDLKAHDRTNIKNVAILLTDGEATVSTTTTAQDGTAIAIQKALDAALDAHKNQNVTFYTIGYSKYVKEKLLTSIAEQTGGKYYYAPDGATLDTIYKQIAQEIGKGSISGSVYNDANRNKSQDASETGLSGWKVTLTNTTTNTVTATATTDTTGGYTFTGVCNGSYKAAVTLQTNWDLTSPTNPNYLSITVAQGNTVADKNFGVAQHPTNTSLVCSPKSITLNSTPQALSVTLKDSSGNPLSGKTIKWSGNSISQLSSTTSVTNANGIASVGISVPSSTSQNLNETINATFAGEVTNSQSSCQISTEYTPQDTTLSLNVLLHGIGAGGDNANPVNSSLSNKTPLHATHDATIIVTDTNNVKVKEIDSTITYDPATGSYKGSFTLGTTFPAGKYLLKVAVDHYLHRIIPGVITLSANKNNVLPTISLIAGDTDSNNKLDILDYNMIIDCYSDYLAPVACDASKKAATDLNDDGNVNQIDNNLFDRELSVQFGD